MTGTGTQADPYIVDNWSDFITAVGTSGVYVEFPKNLVKTSDTEIVEGKLYVDSTGEPVTNPVPANLANYYENTFLLDANNYAPEGLTANLIIRCTSLNGYGGMISNLNFGTHYISSSSTSNTIKNINFSNILTKADRIVHQVYMKKCLISADISTESDMHMIYNSTLYQCGVYITSQLVSSNTMYLGYQHTIKYCRFIFKLPNTLLDMGYSASSVENNLIQGAVSRLVIVGKYLVVDCDVSGNVSGSGSANDIVLVSKGKVSGSISGSQLRAVTTEQLTDAAYLSSIGFPIQT